LADAREEMRAPRPYQWRAVNRSAFVGGTLASSLAPLAVRAGNVDSQIASAAAESTGEVGVFARKMGPGAPIAYNANVVFPAASTIKVLILVSLYAAAEKSPGLLERTVRLQSSDFVGGSDVLESANPGDRIRVSTLARAMIDQSDNTASNALISLLGFDRINATAQRAGLKHTQLKRHFLDYTAIVHHSNNLTTAHDMGTLLYLIERGSREALYTVASPQSCREMIDIMLKQEDRDKIARGLPKGIPLANKTGEIDGVRNDVAIVDPFGDNPYVLAVYTKDLNDFSVGVIAIRNIAHSVHSTFYPQN
jgi:beta-lactamase class A